MHGNVVRQESNIHTRIRQVIEDPHIEELVGVFDLGNHLEQLKTRVLT